MTTPGGENSRRAVVAALVLFAALVTLSLGVPNDGPALQPYPGAGRFLLLSDIHFDPYADPAIMKELGAMPLAPCQTAGPSAVSKYGSDTNYPLLKSALDQVAATAAENHFHYDYVIITGDFLAHDFDVRYDQCVRGGAYSKFASDTIRFVDRMISKALPGVPVFAALGNNDSDAGDYERPSKGFLRNVGRDWSGSWGNVPAEMRARALASFEKAGNYALPHPTAPGNELVTLNSNLWSAGNTEACSETDPDPDGQFQWLEEVLGRVKSARGSATLLMHILPGIDALRSFLGTPQTLWTERCTRKFISELTAFRGVVREIYAGHIHRDDFRLLPDREGGPLCAIHVVPAISPVYLNNPAVEIGWYNKSNGELRDYAPLYLDLRSPNPTWATEYVFTRAYGRPRPSLAALVELSQAIRAGNPQSGVGEQYANFYGAGIKLFLTPENWANYSCAQTEMTLARFAQCEHAPSGTRLGSPKP